jgi:integrase
LLHQIDRKRCREFRDLLHALPSNLRKHFREANRSLEDIAAEAAKRKLPVMARDTQDTYLSALKQLLEWAEKEGHVARNEAVDLTPLGEKGDPKEARDPFTVDQLARIFNAPLYSGCKNDADGYAVPGQNVIRGTRFWIPLIGLYTGMRLNEICQLDLSDIQQSKVGTWFISVNADTPDKTVKNNLSKRSIPIHPDLVRIGFLKFAKTQRDKSKLFPDLKRSGRGYYSERLTRWFNEGFLPKVGVKTDKTSFHSFRHCFRDALRAIDLRRLSCRASAVGGPKRV